MNKKVIFVFTIISAFLLLFSCNYDNRYCEITIHSPQENQVFKGGDLVNVHATILNDGDAVTGEELLVISYPDNDTVFNFKENKFTGKYTLNQNFNVEANTIYKIEVKARGGHGNTATESVTIKTN